MRGIKRDVKLLGNFWCLLGDVEDINLCPHPLGCPVSDNHSHLQFSVSQLH